MRSSRSASRAFARGGLRDASPRDSRRRSRGYSSSDAIAQDNLSWHGSPWAASTDAPGERVDRSVRALVESRNTLSSALVLRDALSGSRLGIARTVSTGAGSVRCYALCPLTQTIDGYVDEFSRGADASIFAPLRKASTVSLVPLRTGMTVPISLQSAPLAISRGNSCLNNTAESQ